MILLYTVIFKVSKPYGISCWLACCPNDNDILFYSSSLSKKVLNSARARPLVQGFRISQSVLNIARFTQQSYLGGSGLAIQQQKIFKGTTKRKPTAIITMIQLVSRVPFESLLSSSSMKLLTRRQPKPKATGASNSMVSTEEFIVAEWKFGLWKQQYKFLFDTRQQSTRPTAPKIAIMGCIATKKAVKTAVFIRQAYSQPISKTQFPKYSLNFAWPQMLSRLLGFEYHHLLILRKCSQGSKMKTKGTIALIAAMKKISSTSPPDWSQDFLCMEVPDLEIRVTMIGTPILLTS